ncbi:unnamed protein product, partial [Prorocentrum cordatum]
MMERVPMDLFEMPHPVDIEAMVVTVETFGVLGATANENVPTFYYLEELTPVLLSVYPGTVQGGSTLTAIVANNSAIDGNTSANTSAITITLGSSIACAGLTDVTDAWSGSAWWNLSSGERVLNCTVSNGTAGVHRVQLLSVTQGLADPSMAPNVTYLPTVEDIWPLTGSLAGGTPLTLAGDGLAGMPCAEITVGGMACSETDASPLAVASVGRGGVVCLTPDMLNGTSLEDAPEEVEVEIVLLRPTPVLLGTFVYAASMTPAVGAVSPATHSAGLTVELVLSGQRLGGGGTPPAVTFGGRPCVVEEHNESHTGCWLQRSVPAPPTNATARPEVWVEGLGRAAVDSSATFTSLFEVTGVSPGYATIAGGAVITVTGSGFHPSDPSKQEVFLDLPDGTAHACAVLSGSDTELQCRLESPAAADDYIFSFYDMGTVLGRRLSSAGARGRIDCARDRSPKTKGHCLAKSIMNMGRVRSMGAEHSLAKGLTKLAAVPPAHAFSGPPEGRAARSSGSPAGRGPPQQPPAGRRLSVATQTTSSATSSGTGTLTITTETSTLTSTGTSTSTLTRTTITSTLTSTTATSITTSSRTTATTLTTMSSITMTSTTATSTTSLTSTTITSTLTSTTATSITDSNRTTSSTSTSTSIITLTSTTATSTMSLTSTTITSTLTSTTATSITDSNRTTSSTSTASSSITPTSTTVASTTLSSTTATSTTEEITTSTLTSTTATSRISSSGATTSATLTSTTGSSTGTATGTTTSKHTTSETATSTTTLSSTSATSSTTFQTVSETSSVTLTSTSLTSSASDFTTSEIRARSRSPSSCCPRRPPPP